MPIVPSRRAEIEALVAQLDSGASATRDAAVARLTLLGERALTALLRYLPGAAPHGAQAALAVLEHIKAPQALACLLDLCRSPDVSVARRAIEASAPRADPRVVKTFANVLVSGPRAVRSAAVSGLARQHRQGVVEALGPLIDVLLDEREDEGLRLSALDAVIDLPFNDIRPIMERLSATRSVKLRARVNLLASGEVDPRTLARRLRGSSTEDGRRILKRLAGLGVKGAAALVEELRIGGVPQRLSAAAVEALRSLPDQQVLPHLNEAIRRAESTQAVRLLCDLSTRFRSSTSITALHAALQGLSRPRASSDAGERAEAKARVHLALAALDSRIALYDLREMLEARPVLAPSCLLLAASRIGDASLVPALAALAADRPDVFDACAETFAAVARRARLRRNSRVARNVRPAHRAVLEALFRAAQARR
jgi:hypothetical protein